MLDRVGSHAEASARFLLDVTRVAHPGARVLDLGAGAGEQAWLFAALGAEVVAIDRVARAVEGVEWRTASIETWCDEPDNEPYDVVFARHVLQQLDRAFFTQRLLPALRDRVREGGVVAIETFFAPPEPPWDHAPASLFRASELVARFPGWSVLEASEHVEQGHDLSGTARRFHVARVLVRKPARG